MVRDAMLVLISSFLSVVIVSFFFIKEPPKVVVVDTSKLFFEFVIAISNSIENEEKAEIDKKIEIHKKAVDVFNKEIVEIAKERNLIILDKRTVIGGVEDQTDQAKDLLKNLMDGVVK